MGILQGKWPSAEAGRQITQQLERLIKEKRKLETYRDTLGRDDALATKKDAKKYPLSLFPDDLEHGDCDLDREWYQYELTIAFSKIIFEEFKKRYPNLTDEEKRALNNYLQLHEINYSVYREGESWTPSIYDVDDKLVELNKQSYEVRQEIAAGKMEILAEILGEEITKSITDLNL